MIMFWIAFSFYDRYLFNGNNLDLLQFAFLTFFQGDYQVFYLKAKKLGSNFN
jgi:hypothetical protein